MSWRSLIIGAVANSHEFFSPAFLEEAERWSPFRFAFLRARENDWPAGKVFMRLFSKPSLSRAKPAMVNCRYQTIESLPPCGLCDPRSFRSSQNQDFASLVPRDS